MTTSAIREKLFNYLQVADDKKVKAIYAMVEDEINTQANDWDDNFIREMDKRTKAAKKRITKTYSWEETKIAAMKRLKTTKK